jgi:hypothetical protein
VVVENRESEMWEWAYRLAASGRFSDTDPVVKELRARGFEHVNKIADSKFAREQIDKHAAFRSHRLSVSQRR